MGQSIISREDFKAKAQPFISQAKPAPSFFNAQKLIGKDPTTGTLMQEICFLPNGTVSGWMKFSPTTTVQIAFQGNFEIVLEDNEEKKLKKNDIITYGALGINYDMNTANGQATFTYDETDQFVKPKKPSRTPPTHSFLEKEDYEGKDIDDFGPKVWPEPTPSPSTTATAAPAEMTPQQKKFAELKAQMQKEREEKLAKQGTK